MNKRFKSLLLLLFVMCNKNTSTKNKIDLKERQFEPITLIFKNAPLPKFYSLINDTVFGGRYYFDKIAYFNENNGLKKYIEPVSRQSVDTITISTNQSQTEINFYQKRLVEKSFLFFSGDSILINYDKNLNPNIKILNRKHLPYDYILENHKNGELSPEEKYFKHLPFLPSKKLTKNQIHEFWKLEREKNGKILSESIIQRKKQLDSLLALKLVSDEIYKYYSTKNDYLFYSYLAKEKILRPETLSLKSNIDNFAIRISKLKQNISNKTFDFDKVLNNKDLGLNFSFYKDFFEKYYLPYNFEQSTTKTTTNFKNFGNTIYEYDLVYDSLNNSKVFSNEVKDYLRYKYMIKIIKDLPSEKVDKYYNKFKNQVNDKSFLEIIQSRYGVKENITNKLKLIDDQKIEYFLEDIINENKGKLIYINIWASWCKPCIEAMSSYHSLVNEYSKKEVLFINISIERDYKDWKKSIRKYAFMKNKNNYLIQNYYTSKFIKDNYINFVPRYLFFDKKGLLINNDAPKPVDLNIKLLIDNYLKEKL